MNHAFLVSKLAALVGGCKRGWGNQWGWFVLAGACWTCSFAAAGKLGFVAAMNISFL
jgi:hypothetical protein